MTEWVNAGKQLMAKHSVIMRYYLTGLTAGEMAPNGDEGARE